MLMVRLQRVGRKNDPSFRVVVTDSKNAAQSGKAIEVLGSHDSRNHRTELNADRINYWLSVGAKVSNTVNNLLVKNGISGSKTIDVSSKKLGKKAQAEKAKVAKVEEKPIEEVKEEEVFEVKEETPEVVEEAKAE